MRTQGPISTISYNSDKFLNSLMNELIETCVVENWCYINHQPEASEKECHKHFYCENFDVVDTDVFRKKFTEANPDGGDDNHAMPFKKSKRLEWLLYALHDEEYMAEKKLTKKYNYSIDDVVFSSESFKEEMLALYLSWKEDRIWNTKQISKSMVQYTRLGLHYSIWITENIHHVAIPNIKNLQTLYNSYEEVENYRISNYIEILKNGSVFDDVDYMKEIATDISKYELSAICVQDKRIYEQLKLVFTQNGIDIN